MPFTMFLISILCCHNGKLLGEKKNNFVDNILMLVWLPMVASGFYTCLQKYWHGGSWGREWPTGQRPCLAFSTFFPWTMLFLLLSYNQKNLFECDCMFTHVHIFIKGQGTLCQYLIEIADSCHTYKGNPLLMTFIQQRALNFPLAAQCL